MTRYSQADLAGGTENHAKDRSRGSGRTSLGVRLTSVIPSSKSTFVGFSDNRGLFVFLVVVILFVFVIIVIIVWVLRWQLRDSDNPRFV